jgi:NAD(P)-dependent dehydrogenase (short-subunit alcohol dehydrogenase family)
MNMSKSATSADEEAMSGGDDNCEKSAEKQGKSLLDEVKVGDDEEIPQLDGVTGRDLKTTVRVLETIAKICREPDPDAGLQAYRNKNLRPFRKALAPVLELHKRTMFNGKEEEAHYQERIAQRSLKRQKTAEMALQKQYVASAALRKGRVEKLKKLQDDAADEEAAKLKGFLIPDGHVDVTDHAPITALLENGKTKEGSKPIQLPKHRSCYVCKIRFRERHHFYDQLCPTCAPLNWEKRIQTADMNGRVAVVTGARVKIGLQVCLKLLRAGCKVVATTRFPNAAVEAYRKQDDFNDWAHLLEVYGLDLRDVTGLEAFTRHLKQKYASGIDILINNACQTVRRPVAYYTPLVKHEQELWESADDTHRKALRGCCEFERIRRRLVHLQHGSSALHLKGTRPDGQALLEDNLDTKRPAEDSKDSSSSMEIVAALQHDEEDEVQEIETTPFESEGISHSAAMSQMVLLPEDAGVSDNVLPPGITDINGHQLDLRTTNSWVLKMEEVSTPEIMECMFVNAIAPFVLNARLKPLMGIPNDDSRPDRYIINVSAMEGTRCTDVILTLANFADFPLSSVLLLSFRKILQIQNATSPADKHGQGCFEHADSNICRRPGKTSPYFHEFCRYRLDQ